MKKSVLRKLLALLLVAAMAASLLSFPAFAEEESPAAPEASAPLTGNGADGGAESNKDAKESGGAEESPAPEPVLGEIRVMVECVNKGRHVSAEDTKDHTYPQYVPQTLLPGSYSVSMDGESCRLTLNTDGYLPSFNSLAWHKHFALQEALTVELVQNDAGQYVLPGGESVIKIPTVCLPEIKDNVTLTLICDNDGPEHSLVLGNQYLSTQLFLYSQTGSMPVRAADGSLSWTLSMSGEDLKYINDVVYNSLASAPEEWGFGYLDDYGAHKLSASQPGPISVTFNWDGEKWVADKNELQVHVVCKYMPEGWTDLYVSANGNDDNPGTLKAPLASLAKAAELINAAPADRAYTVYVMTDLSSTACARFYSRNVTIQSYGDRHTVSRGDGFAAQSDNARSWYNPAMVEIQGSEGSPVLTLRNIVFDDCGRHMGSVYAQAISGEGHGDNLQYVQDAIIASNATTSCTINIEGDAALVNFGGMSAVRVTDKAHVNMNGTISDSATPQKGGGNGPAGAIWIQGGSAYVGGTITGLTGRAVYVDGGSATVAGTISNIKGHNNAWQGQSGVAIHVRGGGYAVLSETGRIDSIKGTHAGYRGAVCTNGSRGAGLYDFEAKPGSVISNVTGFPTLYSSYGTELLNGTITGCVNDFIIGGFAQKTTVGASGVIESCTCQRGAANAIVYTSNASKIYLYGKVRNNTASHAFYIINQSGGGASLDMYNGAEITNTTGEGVYVNASGSRFHMHGGTISGNGTYGAQIREKANNSATFIMDGGSIVNNSSYGVYYNGSGGSGNAQGYVDLNGGVISGNGSDYSPYQVSISGSYARDDKLRAHIAPGVIKADNGKSAAISTSFGTLTLDANYAEINLGNAKSAAANKIKELVGAYESANAYLTRGSALWFRPTEATLHLNASLSSYIGINKSNFLYVAYIPLNADGTPAADAALAVKQLSNTNPIDVSLDGLSSGQPYALMLMQPNDDATGAIQLTGTDSVSEVLGQESYEVDYTFTYQPKNVYSSISVGDEFTATVQLDPNQSYVEDSLQLKSSYYEQVGAPVYNADSHQVSLTFKTAKKVYSSSSATISLKASFEPALFDGDVETLSSTAALDATLASGGKVELETKLPCVTRLDPLPTYTVSFDSNGGSAVESVTVKQGAKLAVPPAPERYLYELDGWYLGEEAYDFDTPVTADLALTAHWTHTHVFGNWISNATNHWRECPCGAVADIAGHNYGAWTVTLAPTTEAEGAQQQVCTVCGHVETMVLDRIPVIAPNPNAPLAPLPPVETVDDELTPLGQQEPEPTPVENIDDEQTPLAHGGMGCIVHWILLVVFVCLLVAYICTAESEKKKIRALNEQL